MAIAVVFSVFDNGVETDIALPGSWAVMCDSIHGPQLAAM